MSLDDIEFPKFMLADLFKNSLVLLETDTKPAEKAKPILEPKPILEEPKTATNSYKFLGKNNKKIVLICNTKEAVFVPDEDLNFLTKLLTACKMNLEDVAIINQAATEINIASIKKQFTPKSLILFGVEPTEIKLPIHFPQFKLQEYDGSVYLLAPSLRELNTDTNEAKVLKSKLWICLKQLFEI